VFRQGTDDPPQRQQSCVNIYTFLECGLLLLCTLHPPNTTRTVLDLTPFTLALTQSVYHGEAEELVDTVSKINLVDLAGSERLTAEKEEATFKGGVNINT